MYEKPGRLISLCFYFVSNFAIKDIRVVTETIPVCPLRNILSSYLYL